MPLRKRFPIFQEKTYLNSCSQGALSVDVRAAYEQYLADWQCLGSPWELWVDKLEATRQSFAALINAQPDEVAVTTSVSASVSALASALDFGNQRNKVVVSDFEFPTIGQIWHAQEKRGAQVQHVHAAGHQVPLERFADAIDERTLLVSITHVCYRNGAKIDVPAIVELAHERGALVLLDSYQSLGTMAIDVKKLNVDFLVGGALKYLLGSAGTAYLYARREHVPTLEPLVSGWFAQEDIFAMDNDANRFSPTARRFEAGTPQVPSLYAAQAGMKLLQSLGMAKIEARIKEVTDALKSQAMQMGLNVVTPVHPKKHGAMIAIRSHKVDLLIKWLARDGIITSSRDGNLRVSPHFYNNVDDVDRLIECLGTYRDLLV